MSDDFFASLKAQFSSTPSGGGGGGRRGGSDSFGGGSGGANDFGKDAARNDHSAWRKGAGRGNGGGDRDEDEDEGESLGSDDSDDDGAEDLRDRSLPRSKRPEPGPAPKPSSMPPPPPRPKQQSTFHPPPPRRPVGAQDVVHIGGANPRLKVVGDYRPDDANALDDVGMVAPKKWARVRPEREWAVTPSVVDRHINLGTPQPKDECFGCVYARNDSTAIEFNRWSALEAMAAKMFSSADLEALAGEMEKFYERYMRGPTLKAFAARGYKGAPPLPEWKAATIVAHFETHNNDFLFRRVKRLRQVDELADYLYGRNMFTWARHKNGELMLDDEGQPIQRIDNDNLSAFSMLCRLEAALYGQNPKTAILSTRSETLAKDVRPALALEGKTFQATDGGLFTGCTPLSFRGGAGEGGTVGAQRKM